MTDRHTFGLRAQGNVNGQVFPRYSSVQPPSHWVFYRCLPSALPFCHRPCRRCRLRIQSCLRSVKWPPAPTRPISSPTSQIRVSTDGLLDLGHFKLTCLLSVGPLEVNRLQLIKPISSCARRSSCWYIGCCPSALCIVV